MEMIPMKKVADATEYPAVLRLLAREVMEGSSYFSVGRWLQRLSSFDLEFLVALSDDVNDEPENAHTCSTFVLLAEMLANAEGLETTEEDVHQRVCLVVTYLSCESLYRKGMIEFDRKRCTFAEDSSGEALAWLKGSARPSKGEIQ